MSSSLQTSGTGSVCGLFLEQYSVCLCCVLIAEVAKKRKETTKMNKFLDNIYSIIIYAAVFSCFLVVAKFYPIIGFSLVLGFFAGMLNNIERVLRELFDDKYKNKLNERLQD